MYGVALETFSSSQYLKSDHIEAEFAGVSGMAKGSDGTLYFSDQFGNRIYKISKSGKVHWFVGSGSAGFRDGRGLNAQFNYPVGLTINSKEILFVCDVRNQAIREITKDGMVSTLLRGPKVGTCIDLDFYEKDSKLIICDITRVQWMNYGNSTAIYTLAGSLESGNVDAVGEKARFRFLLNISVDQSNGNIYATDQGSSTLRLISSSGSVSTLAKNLNSIHGVQVISNDTIIFSESVNNVIKRYNRVTEEIITVAGNNQLGIFDGLGTDSVVANPTNLFYDKEEKRLFVSQESYGVRIINSVGYVSRFLTPFGFGYEDGECHEARFSTDLDFTLDMEEKHLYVVDRIFHVLRRVSLEDGSVETIAGKGYPGYGVGSLEKIIFTQPNSIMTVKDSLLIASPTLNTIFQLNLTTMTMDEVLKYSSPFIIRPDISPEEIYIIRPFLGFPIEKVSLNGTKVDIIAGNPKLGCREDVYWSASMQEPRSVLFDKNGDIYITDSFCNNIRKIDKATKRLITFAGSSDQTVGYNDGFGRDALFNYPFGAAFSAAEDSVLVSDNLNNVIRKIEMDGKVTTYAGNRTPSYRNGNLKIASFYGPLFMIASSKSGIFVGEAGNRVIRIIRERNGTVETLTGIGCVKYRNDTLEKIDLNYPSAIACTDTKLIVANRGDSNVIGIEFQNSKLSLVAGNGGYGWIDGYKLKVMFNRPEGILFDPVTQAIYVADTRNHLIRKISGIDGEVSTYAGNGNAGFVNKDFLSSEFRNPSSLTFGKYGEIFVADSGNHVIRRLFNGFVTTFAGRGVSGYQNGPNLLALFSYPVGIHFDIKSAKILVADTYNHAIRVLNETHVVTLTGSPESEGYKDGSLQEAQISHPKSIVSDSRGTIYIADYGNDKVRGIADGKVWTEFVDTALLSPSGLAVCGDEYLYVSEATSNSIKRAKIVYHKSGNVIKNEDLTSNHVLLSIFISLSGFLLIIMFLISCRKAKSNVTAKLANLDLSKKDSSRTESVTLKPKSKEISIPGYLQIDVKKSVNFVDKNSLAGSGATGVVCLGKLTDAKLIEKHGFLDVAVKIYSTRDDNSELAKDLFMFEVAILSTLPKSRNIVEFVGYHESYKCIIMKFYPTNLVSLIKESRVQLDFTTRLRLSSEISQGMQIIHEAGVVHFDLKPGNILIGFQGEAVICDFGFADFYNEASDSIVKGLKRPTVLGRTARYAAPEQLIFGRFTQLRGKDFTKVDVYAYAMILLFIFTGSKPWGDSITESEIEENVRNGKRPDIPLPDDKIKPIIKRCWAQDPIERPDFSEISSFFK